MADIPVRCYAESHAGWTAEQDGPAWHIRDANGWTLASVHYDYRFTSNATNFERAHLFAAAPEMLAALKECMWAIDEWKGGGDIEKANRRAVIEDVLTKARAAIAKATETGG